MIDPLTLTAALVSLGRTVRARQGELLLPHGLHPGQDSLLLEVWREPGLIQSSLASRLGIESPTVTRMVGRLERVGLVERRRDPDDARRIRVHPTQRSRLVEPAVKRVWQELAEQVAHGIGADEAAELTGLAVRTSRALHRSVEPS